MTKTKKILIFFAIVLMLIMPVVSHAALVPCGVTDEEVLAVNPTYAEDCEFKHVMKLIDTVIKFILFNLAIPIAAVMFAYAGFLMVTSGGSAESKTKAKSIFTNAVIGLVLAAIAWLIIKTLLSILGYTDAGMFFN